MTLSEKIKYERQKKELSQQQLADSDGIHQKNSSKYEKDLVTTSTLIIKNIADKLEVATDYLLGRDTNSIKDIILLKKFKEVDDLVEGQKSALMTVLDTFIRDAKTRKSCA